MANSATNYSFSHPRSLAIPPPCGSSSANAPSSNTPKAAIFMLDANCEQASSKGNGSGSSSSKAFAKELKHRFDKLPIHKACYELMSSSHSAGAVRKKLNKTLAPSGAFRMQRLCSRTIVTGKRRDCLGMTPLHVLACSGAHDVEAYELIIETYPEQLIAKDNWGEIPLLYALWSNAPRCVVQLLAEQQQHFFPERAVDWKQMVETLGRASYGPGRGSASLVCIQNLLHIQQTAFPEDAEDAYWQETVTRWAAEDTCQAKERNALKFHHDTFKYLIAFSVSRRINSIGVEKRRRELLSDVDALPWFVNYRMKSTDTICAKVAHYEHLDLLTEAASLLELALWKSRVEHAKSDDECGADRESCRIRCGADVVVPNVLSFLLPE